MQSSTSLWSAACMGYKREPDLPCRQFVGGGWDTALREVNLGKGSSRAKRLGQPH
jgi:hypothetical protein